MDERTCHLSSSQQSIGCNALQNLYWQNSVQPGSDMGCHHHLDLKTTSSVQTKGNEKWLCTQLWGACVSWGMSRALSYLASSLTNWLMVWHSTLINFTHHSVCVFSHIIVNQMVLRVLVNVGNYAKDLTKVSSEAFIKEKKLGTPKTKNMNWGKEQRWLSWFGSTAVISDTGKFRTGVKSRERMQWDRSEILRWISWTRDHQC